MTRRRLAADRLRGLSSPNRALTHTEAADRRAQFGPNLVVETGGEGWRELVADTVRDPMIWFLLAVSSLYGVVGELREAAILLAAVVPLVGMDAVLHRRARASTAGLRERIAARARVVRGDTPMDVPAVELVPGDLVSVATSEPFPADGVIVRGTELQVDESSLTGEAFPVVKRPVEPRILEGGDRLVDAAHWGLAGTRLLTGHATVRIVYTGGETLYGELARSVASGGHGRTPLQHAIQRLVWVLLGIATMICVLLAGVRLWQGYGWLDAVLSAVTLAVAAIPEEFPVVFTFFLGVGVYRLARRHALVRRAVAVENIGRVTTICSDKTGTITEGRLRLAHLVPAPEYEDSRLLALAAAASRTESGDPLDVALHESRAAAGLPAGQPPRAVFPFTEARRRETVIIPRSGGGLEAVVKGAPETVLAMSRLSGREHSGWTERAAALSRDGHRVIACGWRAVDGPAATEPSDDYAFAGLLAFEDPVKPGVEEAVAACREAGIHVIMLTGDHPLTAAAVAREIGLGGRQPVAMTGDEMEALIARGESAALTRAHVIARAAPAQKLGLVRALQGAGEVVAVTGDGVNDAPALRAADVGIAMGERGTTTARDVAAIVLLDDNFRTIVGAVAEGRQLFRNLRSSFQYLLTIHVPFVASALVIPLLGHPLLYLPIHIVWIELVIHPTAVLAFQARARAGCDRVAGGRHARFFSVRDWGATALTGTLLAGAVIGADLGGLHSLGPEYGRALALATLTLGSAGLATALTELRTRAGWAITGATALSSMMLIQVPALAAALHLTPLSPMDWLIAAVMGFGGGWLSRLVSGARGSVPSTTAEGPDVSAAPRSGGRTVDGTRGH